MVRYQNLISKFKNKKILVIGDVILDQHICGTVSRISPEAPVPVVLQKGDPSFAPGGAANVANNLRSLGARVSMVGRIGRDVEGKILLEEVRKRGVATNGIFVDSKSPTIVKTRIVAQHQQVLRLDREENGQEENARLFKKIKGFLSKNINSFDAIIISDYGKGLITKDLVEFICTSALDNNKVLTVDPKVEHFAYYRGVTAITPNKNEAENAIRNIKITQTDSRKLGLTSDRLKTYKDVEKAGRQLLKFMGLESLLITLGEEGMCLFEKGKKAVHIHTKARDIFDVTGAGDTVISVFTLALTAGATKFQAADIANHAAGIVVSRMGPVAVTQKELLTVIK